jgi:putative flippase GtrA
LPYAVANLISLIVGIFFSFGTQRAWVFTGARDASFWRFCLTWFVLYLLNILLIGIAVHLGLNDYAAGAAVLPIVVAISYVVQGRFVFKLRKP